MTETANTSVQDRQSHGIALTVLGLVIFMAILVGGFVHRMNQPRVMTSAELKLNGAYVFEKPRSLPSFALTDHRGQAFTAESLRDKWTLVFFGFTYCPDVCPTTMALLGQLMGQLQGLPEASDTRVVMVTVDPLRDTVEQLAQYVPYFNPDFTGVTGDYIEIQRFATSLNVAFRKVPGQGENYQVDHSANLVLINPRGDYHGFFRSPLELAKLKVTFRSIRASWDY